MSWRGMVTVLLLLAAIASGWALWLQRKPDASTTRTEHRPDYVLNDFELVVLDKQGQESFTLRAPKLERDPDAQTLDIATPLFVIPPTAGSEGTPWEVRAKTGWVSAEGDELRLRGQVTANNTGRDGKPVHVATEELNVFPDDKRATSAVAVMVRQPGLTMNGRGLEADLKSDSIVLKSDVKARYERSAR